MSDDDTRPFRRSFGGGAFFERAAGGDPVVATTVAAVLELVGSSLEALTPEEFSGLLPEVERRLRLVAHPDHADQQIARLRSVLLTWGE